MTPAQEAQVALGKQLFFDARLSRDGDVSCNTCHRLDRAGVDQRATSIGSKGKAGQRNAPTVFNAAWHVAQFWDGRAADLEAQAKAPILNPNEMAMLSPEAVAQTLRSIPGYVDAFAKAFPEEHGKIDLEHAAVAISAFERTLVSPGRWDRYLSGDTSALTHKELEGLKVFSDVGCVQCHTGELVGGSMFQRVGVAEPWPNQDDLGRYEVTKLDSDKMVFKVPTLRNVTLTAPYFHDGSVANLTDAIQMMSKHQIGSELSAEEVASIAAWLETLTGEAARVAIEPPILPPSSTKTALVH